MATVPAFFRRTAAPAGAEVHADRPASKKVEPDLFQLRPLPHEDVFFYCKKIDNSRLLREADPQSRACWSAIGAACLLLATLTAVMAPSVANTLAGYKLEALRLEERRLTDERRTLELQEAQLLSPERLEKLAEGQNLVTPSSNQVIHLEHGAGGSVAMVKK